MSFLSGAAHLAGIPVAAGAKVAGAVTGAHSLTNLGHNITNPNVTLSNPGGVLSSDNKAFTSAPGMGAYGTPAVGNIATWGTGAAQPTGNDTSGAYSGAYTGGGAASGTYDPQTAAYYDNATNQANSGIARLGNQEQIGLGNINQGYQSALNTLLAQKAITDRDYQTSKDQTLQDNVQAKSNIDFGVGQHNNSLQRLLGAHGYSGSANQAAAYSAAQQGSQQRGQVSQAFGRNQQALDTNYGDYNNQFGDSRNGLDSQKSQQESDLHSKIAQNKVSLLSQLASISQQRGQAAGKTYQQALQEASPYQAQIDAINGQIDSYGANPAFTPKAAVYHAPTLESYNYDKTQAPSEGGLAGAGDNINPYLGLLLGQTKKFQNLGF